MNRLRVIALWFEKLTLKKRIVLLFGISALVPFICTVLLSYNAMSSILQSKLKSSVKSNLTQVQLSLENAYNSLNTFSQQLAMPGNIAYKLQEYTLADDTEAQERLAREIRSELSLMSFTNPSVTLAMYYSQSDGQYMFENTSVKETFSLTGQRQLSERYLISNFAPHISNERYNNELVISAFQEMGLPGRDDMYIYVESGYGLTRNLIDNGVGEQSFLLLDTFGQVAYSELPSHFEPGELFADGAAVNGLLEGYYWFKSNSNQGWSIVSLVPKADYNAERDRWVVQIALLSLLFLVITLLIAWVLWKMLYKPLHVFNKEIKWLSNNQFQLQAAQTRIPEFDSLLTQFRTMKVQISDLFTEIETKEKKRADLEIEKLLYQINPHFLMNTLDTVHWLAVMNGQNDIDRLVSALNKLLYYNLGKLGQQSTIGEELESLKQYLLLQQIRYNFAFDLEIDADEQAADVAVPRFILQPLVENSLYHGLSDDGYIRVKVRRLEEKIVITVSDNGRGMTEEDIRTLLTSDSSEQRKVGMGIGMNYVKRMIDSYYEGQARLEIDSTVGEGTTVRMTLPISEGEENK